MFSARLKQLRLARGLSLDELSTCLEGMVTKQALSKYEKGLSQPSVKVAAKIAEAFGVKTVHLFSAPTIQVEFFGYRKCASMPKRDEKMIENMVPQELEARVLLQEKVGETSSCDLPIKKFRVEKLEDAEPAAMALRQQWELGTSPIAHVVALLESRCIHVFAGATESEKFDGTSALACDESGTVRAAAVVFREGVSGERQRFSLMHEVAHLVLDVAAGVDEEKAAHRFAGAFLAPAEQVRREIGAHRSTIQLRELLILKKYFGLSVQALAFRLRDLGIINDSTYTWLCIQFNKHKMRRSEPEELALEEPQWLKRTVLRALSEGILSPDEAGRLTGDTYDASQHDYIDRRAFMQLPLEERNKVLRDQAEQLQGHYEKMKNLGGGDFLDY